MESLKKLLQEDTSKTVTWIVAFTGVCVLVGLGKIKPETVEYLLFALGGAVATRSMKKGSE